MTLMFMEVNSFKKNNNVLILKSPFFRTSYQKLGKPVNQIIKETLPNTAILIISSMIIAVFIDLFRDNFYNL